MLIWSFCIAGGIMQTNAICFQSLAGHANVWCPGFITSPWGYTSRRMIQVDTRVCMWCSSKKSPGNGGDSRDLGSISRSGKSLGVGNGNPFQYPCLENSMDRGVWLAIVHGVTKSQTRLSMHPSFMEYNQLFSTLQQLYPIRTVMSILLKHKMSTPLKICFP